MSRLWTFGFGVFLLQMGISKGARLEKRSIPDRISDNDYGFDMSQQNSNDGYQQKQMNHWSHFYPGGYSGGDYSGMMFREGQSSAPTPVVMDPVQQLQNVQAYSYAQQLQQHYPNGVPLYNPELPSYYQPGDEATGRSLLHLTALGNKQTHTILAAPATSSNKQSGLFANPNSFILSDGNFLAPSGFFSLSQVSQVAKPIRSEGISQSSSMTKDALLMELLSSNFGEKSQSQQAQNEANEEGGPEKHQDGKDDQAEVDQDGTTVDQDGTTVDQDGTTVDQDGTTVDEDGTKVDEDGTKVDEDGTTVDEDGTTVDQDGTTVDEDGTKVDEDGTTVDEDGTKVDEDGTKVDQNGTKVKQYREDDDDDEDDDEDGEAGQDHKYQTPYYSYGSNEQTQEQEQDHKYQTPYYSYGSNEQTQEQEKDHKYQTPYYSYGSNEQTQEQEKDHKYQTPYYSYGNNEQSQEQEEEMPASSITKTQKQSYKKGAKKTKTSRRQKTANRRGQGNGSEKGDAIAAAGEAQTEEKSENEAEQEHNKSSYDKPHAHDSTKGSKNTEAHGRAQGNVGDVDPKIYANYGGDSGLVDTVTPLDLVYPSASVRVPSKPLMQPTYYPQSPYLQTPYSVPHQMYQPSTYGQGAYSPVIPFTGYPAMSPYYNAQPPLRTTRKSAVLPMPVVVRYVYGAVPATFATYV